MTSKEMMAGTTTISPETVDFADTPQKTRFRLYNIRLNPFATSLSESDLYDCHSW